MRKTTATPTPMPISAPVLRPLLLLLLVVVEGVLLGSGTAIETVCVMIEGCAEVVDDAGGEVAVLVKELPGEVPSIWTAYI